VAVADSRPPFSCRDAERLVRERYGIDGRATELVAEFDRNFLIETDPERRFVLKISPADLESSVVQCQVEVLAFLSATGLADLFQRVQATVDGLEADAVRTADGSRHWVRLLTYLSGHPLADLPVAPDRLLRQLGATLAQLDQTLLAFDHPGAHRETPWNLVRALRLSGLVDHVVEPDRRDLVLGLLNRFRRQVAPQLARLPHSVIYNDANPHNILVDDLEPSSARLCGLVDFGDMVFTATVSELAIACAYAMLDRADPLAAAAQVAAGYDALRPLTEAERRLLYDLIVARLCSSVLMSAGARVAEPDNEYRMISSDPVWRLLEELAMVDADEAAATLYLACGGSGGSSRSADDILATRRRHLGYNLSVSYRTPLKIVRGEGQYLFDDNGRRYLDLVNNVCHVGHCHPHVVAAGQRQMAALNTNTRYLHDGLAEYVERLTATFPEPLSVCFLVCTGSEANDLALRLARAHTGSRGVVVLDHAYHGNSPSLVEISPYKCEGPGGEGLAPHAHKVAMPDPFRGRFRGSDTGVRYAELVAEAVARLVGEGRAPGAFIAESLIGCGGQIVLPTGYLEAAYRMVRSAGGVCIADEVQVGFGRVGSHMWGFETQSVVPDIVTLGKPIGNGHPLAAVITTPEIARSFDTGMEYFNTFGGNPVSCAIGCAVLDVIEREDLQRHAADVGGSLMAGLRRLQARHELIGDVRGLGLFVGVELVWDDRTLTPAGEEAGRVVEAMRDRGFLLSTDGPDHNVIKIKPPMVLQHDDVNGVLTALDDVLASLD
jgi:4-aminobutyrate aminotransferase-like enzyme/Ser/Thr protein kinase RdoA (MazF antagonist)